MRKLIIVRHAKSGWETGVRDFNRTLSIEGKQAAIEISNVLKDYTGAPDYVICSPADRTTATASLLLKGWFDLDKILFQDSIYEGTLIKLLNLINLHIGDEVENLMLIGHNPGVSDLVEYLSEGNIGSLPTCSCVCLTSEVDSWELASKGIFSVEWNIYPKMFSF